jgi:hypothetical protein
VLVTLAHFLALNWTIGKLHIQVLKYVVTTLANP